MTPKSPFPFQSLSESVALVDAWADGLLGRAWFDWFVTLTFRHNVSSERASAAWSTWARWVRRKQGYRPEWFRVAERTLAGRIHFHALVGHCAAVRRLSALDFWRDLYGFGQVMPYDPELGARYYLSKYAVKEAAGDGLEWAMSRHFDRLLGRGPVSGIGSGKARQGAVLMPAPGLQDGCR